MSNRAFLFDRGICTYVDSTDASAAHDSSPYARMEKTTTMLLIREGLGNIPAGAVANGCAQTFRTVGNFGGGSVVFRLYRLASPWSAGVLWADRPGFTADAPITVTGTVTAGGLLSFDVTAFDALAIASPASDYGYGLILDTAGVSGYIYTLAASDGVLGTGVTVRPTHGGEYRISPPAPLSLSPSGGRAIGASKPVVTADFGDTDVLAVQFQSKATNTGFVPSTGFASPAFDSGTVLTGDASLDLATTAFGGFGNTAAYWTLRVKNTDGSWSDYAQPVATRYAPKSVTTIGLTGTIGSPLLTVPFSATGTMTAYQVLTADAVSPVALTTNSGVLPGSVTSYTTVDLVTKKPYLLPDERDVIITVRTFDNVTDREETPGCPIYSEATTTAAYADNVTAKRAGTLIVTQIESSPWNMAYVTLDSRLGSTDAIILKRDGAHIGRYRAAELPPPDTSEGGFTYAVPDYTAQARVDHIYGAKIDTGTRTSRAIEYVFIARNPTGLWVIDLKRAVYAMHSGTIPGVTTSDQVGVMTGLGQGYPIIQMVAPGGKAGTWGGQITDTAGLTAVEWEQAWRDLAHNFAEVQMAYANTSFPARIWNVNVTVNPDDPSAFRKLVDFSFAQTGKESLDAEPIGGTGQVVTKYDLEEGTNNATILVESGSTGSPGVIATTGTPTYKTASAKHHLMGGQLDPGDTVSYGLKSYTASSNSVYLRIAANTATNGFDNVMSIDNISGGTLALFRLKQSGLFNIEDNAGNELDRGASKTSFGTTDADWLRVDFALSWDGSTSLLLRFSIAFQDESYTYTDILTGVAPATVAPYALTLKSTSHLTIDFDSVRVATDASADLGPILPNAALPSPQLVLTGGVL